MEKININNLFAPVSKKPINVNDFINTTNSPDNSAKVGINIDKLINLREERKQKIVLQYDKIFKICINKINMANNLNKTEVIYDVPEVLFGYSNYNINECILYITNKLKESRFDTIILGKSIYISWLQ